MREAAGDAGIAATMVPIPGQPVSKGLTALLHSSTAPYPQHAEHLASFGAQAALVAGSPYYQLLVGLILVGR